MVYLTNKEANKIIKELSNSHNKEIKEIIKKLKSSEKRKIYVTDTIAIKKLLQKAFDEKRKVKIRYYSPHSDEFTTREIDIYQINANSIVTYCHLRDDERVFAIERIRSAAILDEKYSIPKDWNPENIIL